MKKKSLINNHEAVRKALIAKTSSTIEESSFKAVAPKASLKKAALKVALSKSSPRMGLTKASLRKHVL